MSRTIDGAGIPIACIHSVSDGKLIKYGITTRFSISDKKRLIGCLIEVIRDRANEQVRDYGIQGLQIIQESTGAAPNWQGADGMFADDVICEICEILVDIRDEEIIDTAINHISEQMKDMLQTQGTCPSGRCNRLHQVYMILRDTVDGVHLSSDQRKTIYSVNNVNQT